MHHTKQYYLRRLHRYMGVTIGIQFLLWMLHVMDYESRDHLGNWLVRTGAVLGLWAIVSGFTLGVTTSPSFQ